MKYFKSRKKLVPLTIFISLYLLALVPLLVFSVKQRQESRSHAESISGQVCQNVPTDMSLVMDTSGSMNDIIGSSSASKLDATKASVNKFIDDLNQEQTPENANRVGLVTFSSTATVQTSLTTDYESVKTQINALTASGSTCAQCGINQANNDLETSSQSGTKKIVVLLTDSTANTVNSDASQSADISLAEQQALNAAIQGHTNDGTVYFTIGLGDGVDKPFLQKLAIATGGKFYFPSPDELDNVFQEISQLIGKGFVSGFVYNDNNVNGNLDTNEQGLPGQIVTLTTTIATDSAEVATESASLASQSATTDDSGMYTISGICDGNYTLSQNLQEGWKQTQPASESAYTINITNGTQYSDKNFGTTDKTNCNDGIDNDGNGLIDASDPSCHTDSNAANSASYDPTLNGEQGVSTCSDGKDNNSNGLIDAADPACHTNNDLAQPFDPTLSETGNPTLFDVTVSEHGIGTSGDNTNPDGSLSNKNPLHTTISAGLELYNESSVLIATGSGTLTYASASGNYIGTISIPKEQAVTGRYTMKIVTPYHLKKLLDGTINIQAGLPNTIQPVALVGGDIDNSNSINILDYNLLLNCFSNLTAATNCSDPQMKTATDLNDDGNVDQIDYNLFLREIATEPGQ